MLMRTSNHCATARNQFLAGLSRQDAALLEGVLERVEIAQGAMLMSRGTPLEAIYFPETIIVSIGEEGAGHGRLETALIGYEGIIGWSGFGNIDCAMSDAVVQMAGGTAWRASRTEIRRACSASPTLLVAALRVADVLAMQMTQAILSHVRDTVERRVCRWLLMRHDRLLTDHLRVCHDEIGNNLGVRRASVTDCLHILEGEHLVRCRRGRIIIRDRRGLERTAGASYGAAEAYHRDQIGPFGRSISLHSLSRATVSLH